MDQETEEAKVGRWTNLAFHAGGGVLMLLISGALTAGLVLEAKPPDWGPADTRLAIALLGVCWCLTIALLAGFFQRTRLKKLGSASYAFAILLFMVFQCAIWLRPGSDHAKAPPAGMIVFESVLLLTITIGLLLFLSDRRKARTPASGKDEIKRSPLMIIFWPAMLLLKWPVGALLYLIVASGTAYLGKWIGEKYSHPALGAIGLPVSLFLVFLAIAILFAFKKKHNDDPSIQAKK